MAYEKGTVFRIFNYSLSNNTYKVHLEKLCLEADFSQFSDNFRSVNDSCSAFIILQILKREYVPHNRSFVNWR